LASALCTIAGSSSAYVIAADADADKVLAQVAAGKQLFDSTCITCHGSGGVGGTGPPLTKRGLPVEVIRDAVLSGRAGTPMPSFNASLSPQLQAQVIAYVWSLSSGGREPTAIVAPPPQNLPASAQTSSAQRLVSAPSSEAIRVGDEGTGIPARGLEAFFDATRLESCRTCHSYNGKGGPMRPDLATVARQPEEIYHTLTNPNESSRAFPAIDVTMRDGSKLQGIMREENGDVLVLFDVSSLPLVIRTIPKAHIASVMPTKSRGLTDHTSLRYQKQELLDLSALLGQSAAPAAR
jgi:putative heme-binding domain-containing protein